MERIKSGTKPGLFVFLAYMIFSDTFLSAKIASADFQSVYFRNGKSVSFAITKICVLPWHTPGRKEKNT